MGERFDDLTRALARGASRREAVKALAAGAGAVVVTWLGAGRVQAGQEDPDGSCRPDGTPCRFRRQCCSRNCVDAQCKCRGDGKDCRSSAQCCSTICEKGICNCRDLKEPCTSDTQCCQDESFKGKPLNVRCRKNICTCSFPGETCLTSEDCCFSDNFCLSGTCQFP